MAKIPNLPACAFPAVSTRGALATLALAFLAPTALAQLQFDELRQYLPPDRDPTRAVAMGDVDGDGDPDLVFGNTSVWNGNQRVGGQNRLYLNDGTGTFTDVTAARMPADRESTSYAVALGDVHGDGDPK